MNIVEQFSGAAAQVGRRVRNYRESAVERARKRVSRAAEVMAAARAPVDTLVSATQRLNDLSHDTFSKLLSQNASAIDGLIHGGVERLKLLAQADDLRSFLRTQAGLSPAARERLSRDLRQLWSIATVAGREFGTLASETYAELLYGVSPRSQPVTRRKARRRSAKKTVRAKRAH